jgi:phosphoglycerate dehydrogenase-like enzyme
MKITEGMIGERQLRALPKRAFLLNPERGSIIQEKALIRALEEKWFSGAALDTHYQYPLPGQDPLWRMPNVILTPHISGSNLTPFFIKNLGDLFVQNANRFSNREQLLNQLTPAQLAGE